jgi:hypothetical protein
MYDWMFWTLVAEETTLCNVVKDVGEHPFVENTVRFVLEKFNFWFEFHCNGSAAAKLC